MSVALIPNSASTSAVWAPSSGAGWRTAHGVPESFTGNPTMRTGPWPGRDRRRSPSPALHSADPRRPRRSKAPSRHGTPAALSTLDPVVLCFRRQALVDDGVELGPVLAPLLGGGVMSGFVSDVGETPLAMNSFCRISGVAGATGHARRPAPERVRRAKRSGGRCRCAPASAPFEKYSDAR